MDFVSDKHAVK